jgi:hypothetical protein
MVAGRWMGSVLFGVRPADVVTTIGVSAALLGIAVLSAAWPAMVASRIDPSHEAPDPGIASS